MVSECGVSRKMWYRSSGDVQDRSGSGVLNGIAAAPQSDDASASSSSLFAVAIRVFTLSRAIVPVCFA